MNKTKQNKNKTKQTIESHDPNTILLPDLKVAVILFKSNWQKRNKQRKEQIYQETDINKTASDGCFISMVVEKCRTDYIYYKVYSKKNIEYHLLFFFFFFFVVFCCCCCCWFVFCFCFFVFVFFFFCFCFFVFLFFVFCFFAFLFLFFFFWFF